jgi:hypothetical protein
MPTKFFSSRFGSANLFSISPTSREFSLCLRAYQLCPAESPAKPTPAICHCYKLPRAEDYLRNIRPKRFISTVPYRFTAMLHYCLDAPCVHTTWHFVGSGQLHDNPSHRWL